MVYGVCRLILRDADEAEDAAQQVFLSAYRSLLAGTEPRNAGAWLGTIARNEARGRAATRGLRPVAFDGGVEPVTISLEEQADARADLAELRSQLAALPVKQREAIVLRDLYGLRYDEVAQALNTSRPAVEGLLFRGRRRLQRHLRPEVAAGVLVVPLALRESLAYAVPGFAAGGASAGGVLAKLAVVPVAAKLMAAGITVGAVGSAGVIAERELRDPRGHAPRAVPAVVEQETSGPLAATLLPVGATLWAPRPSAVRPAREDEDEDRRELQEAKDENDETVEGPAEDATDEDDRDGPEEQDRDGRERAGDDDEELALTPRDQDEEGKSVDEEEADESLEADESDSPDEED